MKQIKFISAILLATVFIVFNGCDEENDNEIGYLSISDHDRHLNFEKEGGVKEVIFEVNCEWAISIHEETDGKEPTWLNISSSKGNAGNHKIQVKTTPNNTEMHREAYLNVQIKNEMYSGLILIRQNAQPYSIHVEIAGSLGSLIGTKIHQINNLIISGNLNGDDIKVIRNMELLRAINMEDVNIKSGGKSYYTDAAHTDYFTKENVFPAYMFYFAGRSSAAIAMRMTSVILPKSITTIGEASFWDNEIENIIIPNNVTSIENSAFAINSFTDLIIPNSVTSIGRQAFYECTKLTNVKLPNSIKTIQGETFYRCKSLTKIVIPNSVTFIGKYAFLCENLAEVQSNNPIPPRIQGGTVAFANTRNCILYVPKGSYTEYLLEEEWKNFKEIIEKDIPE
jgi:hypothetical protein